jgi:hypothetical protein
MLSVSVLAGLGRSFGVGTILGAAIDAENSLFSLSPWHDGAVITACVSSAVISISAPLCVIKKNDSLSEVVKASMQIFVWLLTLVSIFWAGRIAAELLLRADNRNNPNKSTVNIHPAHFAGFNKYLIIAF